MYPSEFDESYMSSELSNDTSHALHAVETAAALNRMQPRFLSALTVTPEPGTPLMRWVQNGKFISLDVFESMKELHGIISELELESTIFRSNHVSNAFPLAGRFPRDKGMLLKEIEFVLSRHPSIPADDHGHLL